jgi:probable rRNA maturation factor
MLKINIYNYYNEDKTYNRVVNYILKRAYKTLKIKEKMIANIILVDNEKIKELNSQYRKIDNETDVLSFENDQGLAEIGDIFISIDKAKEQAKDYEHSFERELAFLSVHGFLHCLGYDHLNKNDEEVMFDLQKQILDNSKYRRNS